jgi:tRNA modification GTPase
VFNKADAITAAALDAAGPDATLAISATTGAGLDSLRDELLARAGGLAEAEGVFIARARHVEALRRARAHLAEADVQARAGDTALELVAEELRGAHDALGEITGTFTSEDLLGAIFSRFCIGK